MSARCWLLLACLSGGCGAPMISDGADGSAAGDGGALADLLDDGGAALDDLRPVLGDGGYGTTKGKVQLTYYWVANEADYTGVKDTILCDVDGATITTVALAFANAIRLEG